MKFIYVDESGGPDQSDVFAICGLMVDAYGLRKKTQDFDELLKGMFAGLPVQRPPRELKTKKFIEGGGPWKAIDGVERKEFLTSVCQLAVANGGKVFGVALSFAAFDHAKDLGLGQPTQGNRWLASAMYACCLLLKKMQGVSGRKGLTVFIVDDNKREMPKLSERLPLPCRERRTPRPKLAWSPAFWAATRASPAHDDRNRAVQPMDDLIRGQWWLAVGILVSAAIGVAALIVAFIE